MIYVQATNIIVGEEDVHSSTLGDVKFWLPSDEWELMVSTRFNEMLVVRGCLLVVYLEDYNERYSKFYRYLNRLNAYLVGFSSIAAWFYTSQHTGIDVIGKERKDIYVVQRRLIEV